MVVALLVALSSVSPLAVAQEPPLAVPADPGAFEKKAAAMMAYRTRHLTLRGLTLRYPGGATVVHSGYGWGWGFGGPSWGWGASYVIHNPDVIEYSWAVFQGQSRLTVPAYLSVVGDVGASEELGRKIRSNRQASSVLYVAGTIGAGGRWSGCPGRRPHAATTSTTRGTT